MAELTHHVAFEGEAELPTPETPLQEAWRIFQKDRLALSGLVVLVLLVAMAAAGKVLTEWVVVFDPATVRLPDKFLPPLSSVSQALIPAGQHPLGGVYLLGTDELGRDVFARMLQGSFVSLSIGFIAVGISVTIGIILGGLSGFYGNVKLGLISVDTLIMRFTDIMLCFPTFFLILTVVALLPPSIYNIMIVIGLTSWMATARFVRAEFLALREQDFVVAAQGPGLARESDHLSAYGPERYRPGPGLGHHRRGRRYSDRVGSQLSRVRGAAAVCDLGQYPGQRPRVYL